MSHHIRIIHTAIFLLVFLCINLSAVRAEMIDYPEIKIQALNKSTARSVTLKTKVGSTIEYGSLFIKTQACRKSQPLDKPEDAAFLQIWEVPIGKDKSEWAFSGWMFASSPAVSAMDHPVYDVWVLECLDSNAKKVKPVNKVIVNDVEVTDELDDSSTNADGESDEKPAQDAPAQEDKTQVKEVPVSETNEIEAQNNDLSGAVSDDLDNLITNTADFE